MNVITETLNELVSPIRLKEVDGAALGIQMNALIKGGFTFYRGTFAGKGREFVIAEVRTPGRVDLLARQYERFLKQLKIPLIFYFNELKPRERSRLVKHRVQFVVGNKFLHAPQLGIFGETPVFDESWNNSLTETELSAWAETVVIKRLLDDATEGMTGNQLAEFFGITQMTVSRAVRELENFGLCTLEKKGTEKKVRFGTKRELWQKAQKLLTSPVIGTVELAELPLELPLAGDPALEHYTMIAGIPPKTYAIYKREFLQLKRKGKIKLPKIGEEKLRLQLWKRDPKPLAQGKHIDPISLYFSERNSTDDRIQVEIRRMMNELGLGVSDDE
ncbi:MAG: winged helix-turn-helix domain-containing protein [Oligoflexia bacterium]|nr:winged helix-turn-helix domain-containing protein [Oligoflexia bacterium]